MKLHDVIKEAKLSKTRIRRKSWEEGIYREVCAENNTSLFKTVYAEEEVLADDWIVEELALKPCPLCGSAVEIDEFTADHEEGLPKLGKVWIQCSNSKCIIDIEETLRFTTKEEFIKKWNTRAGVK